MALVKAIVDGTASSKRVYVDDIETFVRVLREQKDSAQVNLLFYNRAADGLYTGTV